MSTPWLSASVTASPDAPQRAKGLNGALPLDGRGAVLITRPTPAEAGDAPMSVGSALDASLIGSTASFTMLVGYFAHGGLAPGFKSDLDAPARLILRELNDPDDHGPEGAIPTTRFRLLFGELRSHVSRQALYRWWSLCEWRVRDPAAADQWRRDLLATMHTSLTGGAQSEQALHALARRVVEPNDPLCPFAEGKATDPIRAELSDQAPSHGGVLLLLFLVQRSAEIRCGKALTKDHRIFHPKLYVVERGPEASLGTNVHDTIVIAGSANWSGAALSASHEANVELATIHRVSGHAYASGVPGASLGVDLALTARALFEEAHCFASWERPEATRHPTAYLEVPPAQAIGVEDAVEASPEELVGAPPLRTVPTDLARLAHAIVRDIELALGVDSNDLAALREAVGRIDPKIWGNKTPSPYQIDGALRLLVLLGRSRGALLTDEPGLGKTLIAQLVTALLISRCITRRLDSTSDGPKSRAPVQVSILAPARVLGKSAGDGGTRWHGYATEIRAAVRALLEQDQKRPERVMWADEEHLIIRPLTNQSLSRKVLLKDPANKSQESIPNKVVIDDLRHLSESEVVVLDEAHNFRNGNSAATRVLRFCLSMPTPGEGDWRRIEAPLGTADQAPLFDSAAVSATEFDRAGRKILLLTATPFNNRIDDVRTQLGHFAKAMDWSETKMLPPDMEAYERRVAKGGATVDSSYWQPPTAVSSVVVGKQKASKKSPPPPTPPPTSRDDFTRLVLAAAQHFDSSRALDEDDTKDHARISGAKTTKRQPPSDRGPRYAWAQQHQHLGAIFAAITRTVAAKNAGDDGGEEYGELRNRVDAMLVGHVVQRSRRQVLSLVKARDPAEPSRMFRAPEQPRVPVPVAIPKEKSEELNTFEAEVLARLFELVTSGDTKVGTTEVSKVSTTEVSRQKSGLTMMAYTLRYERGMLGQGAADGSHRGATNFIGFQAIGLVKRLQSSPYAFVMTLVRGLFRTCMYEIALTHEVLDRIGPRAAAGTSKSKKTAQLSLVDVPKVNDAMIAAAAHRMELIDNTLLDYLRPPDRGGVLLRLLGITPTEIEKADRRTRLWRLAGLGDPSTPPMGLTRSEKALRERLQGTTEQGDPESDVAVAVEQLLGATSSRRRGKDAKNDVGAEAQVPWAHRLLGDVGQPVATQGAQKWRPGLLGDLFLVLDWLVGDPLVLQERTALLKHVFHGVEFASADSAANMDVLATRFRESAKGSGWLRYTLENDSRAADLLAWLLAQTVARRALSTENAPRDLREQRLPAGIKSLIFSEYADTLAYLRAVIIALHGLACAAPGAGLASGERVRLLESIRARILDVAQAMHERLAQTDVRLPSPVDPELLLRALKKPAHDTLVNAIKDLYEASALLTSRQASGQRFSVTEASASEPAPTDLDDSLGTDDDHNGDAPSVANSSALDAFSPWYQIDPREDAKVNPWVRLHDAHVQPVHALMATEVLAEGVNLQECGVVIHYDLPWNPTRLIQRNGRVDRRVDPTVENDEQRRERATKLVPESQHQEAVALADRFWPPKHIYHLTVPPIEPELQADARKAYARKVREILFTKLSGIREIFGLAAWPIVLEQDEARRVLDGSLAYETPAFRRREDLFVAHETMALLAARAPEAKPTTSGSLLVTVKPELMARIHRGLVGLPEDDSSPPTVLPTEKIRAIALMSWSPVLPNRIPVRSHVDLRPLEHALREGGEFQEHFRQHWGITPERTGFLSLLGWIGGDPGTSSSLLAWRVGVATGSDGKPISVLEPALLTQSDASPSWVSGQFRWRALAGVTSAQAHDVASEVLAPTAAFEVALIALAGALEDQCAATKDLSTMSEGPVATAATQPLELPSVPSLTPPWMGLKGHWIQIAGRALGEVLYSEDHPPPGEPPLPPTLNLLIVPGDSP
jgi:hypothetical protein